MFNEGKCAYICVNGVLTQTDPVADVLIASVDELPALGEILAPGSRAFTAGHADEYELGLNGEWYALKTTPVVTLTAATASKTYDGTELTASTVTATGLPQGFSATATASGTITDAGVVANVVDKGYVIKDGSNNVVTDQFICKLVDGTLTVNKKALTIETGSDTKVYDGDALTCDTVTVTGLVTGETLTATATGTQTEIGESENTYELEWGTAKPGNYEITETLGTLSVTEETEEETNDDSGDESGGESGDNSGT